MNDKKGLMDRDLNHNSIQAPTGFATQDATDTPLTSPLAYLTASETEIIIPDNAVTIYLKPSTDLKISEVTGLARYTTIPAGVQSSYGISALTSIFIQGASADGNVEFFFDTLN